MVERYLKEEAGVPFSIVRPCTFFENFDAAANHNPLVKGKLFFLSTEMMPFVATDDIGRAAVRHFEQPSEWLGKTTDVISWKGTLADAAAALETVSGVKVKHGLAMPLWARRLFLATCTTCASTSRRASPRARWRTSRRSYPTPSRRRTGSDPITIMATASRSSRTARSSLRRGAVSHPSAFAEPRARGGAVVVTDFFKAATPRGARWRRKPGDVRPL
jgi:hypothetical protein